MEVQIMDLLTFLVPAVPVVDIIPPGLRGRKSCRCSTTRCWDRAVRALPLHVDTRFVSKYSMEVCNTDLLTFLVSAPPLRLALHGLSEHHVDD
jgi:hypothetical protein